mgnify:CR=1 FL=1
MGKIKKRRNFLNEFVVWTASLAIASLAAWFILPQLNSVTALVTNNGVLFFGDTTNAGTIKARTFNNPSTFAAEISGQAASASNIVHLATKTAPTREEIMIGHLKVDGRLDIQTCTTGCDATADYTARWNNPGTTATQDCDNVPTLDTCTQAFDLAYESLSGKAMVVYADNVADTAYYAVWDGSSWSPNSTPGTPGVSNDIDLPGTAGTPKWIRVISAGDNLADDRSNRIMLLVSDSNADLHAFYWDGSAWDAGTTLFSTLGLCDRAQCFDGDWQGNNTFVVSYTNSAANELRYQKYTVGTGWSGDTLMYSAASAQMWVTATSDPTSSRIYVSTATQAENARAFVWRADDATDGWTECASGGCPDTTTETVGSNIAYPAFERFNGEAINHYLDAGNGTAATSGYWTYTPASTWSTRTATGMAPTDDYMQVKAIASPNNDDIMLTALDVDCDLDAQMWNGSALSTAGSNLELLVSSTNNLCANATPIEGMSVGYAVDFAWKIYSPWQRNWQFYSGSDTASIPTTALANENTAPTDIATTGSTFRLRANYADRGLALLAGGERLKLQYTSGCNPNTSLETTCTWIDVDDIGGIGIWRYKDLACTPTDCADNMKITGTVLTGTNSTCASGGNGCGQWITDKDAAAGNFIHNAGITQEAEWIVESNGSAASTTYYFRINNIAQDTPIYREQDANDCGAGSAQCTYPSLTTAAPPGPTTDEIMRHGNWFSSGVEQDFFWAD